MTHVTSWWWIRHAPVVSHAGRIYGALDVPCDTSEAAVYDRLARLLPDDPLWITSQLGRAQATADAIEAAAAADPVERLVETAFAEQSFGDWQGMSYRELDELRDGAWHRFWLTPAEERPPGGESFVDVMARVAAAVRGLSVAHAGRQIVAVAHGGTIRAALAQALSLEPERALAFEIANCSVTRIDHIAGSPGSHAPEVSEAWRVGQVNADPRHFLD